GFCDHVAGVRADQMHAQHAVGLGIGDNFYETIGGQIDLGATISGEWKLADVVGDTGSLQFLFAFADGGDFRIGVDHVGNGFVVHVARLADENLGDRDAFILGLVRQHRSGNHIADRPDARHAGGVVVIDRYAAAFVDLYTDFLESEAFGVWHAPDGDKHNVSLDRFRRATFGRFDLRLQAFS